MNETKLNKSIIVNAFSECRRAGEEISNVLMQWQKSSEQVGIVDSLVCKCRILAHNAAFMGWSEINHAAVGLEHLCGISGIPDVIASDMLLAIKDVVDQINHTLQSAEEQGCMISLPISTRQTIASLLECKINSCNDGVKASSPSGLALASGIIDASGLCSGDERENVLAHHDMTGQMWVNGAPVRTDESGLTRSKTADAQTASVRVSISLLDRLVNLAGELVLVRNQFLQMAGDAPPSFQLLGENLNAVTMELQTDVMKTRMQPIGSLFSKTQRICRDLSRDLRKRVEINIEGADVELDKSILESIRDPLLHLARNSIDHGIERPDERLAAGKKESGTLGIKAHHENGQVVVEIKDDGKGLARDKIVNTALQMGVIRQDQVSKLTDAEVHNLIFTPGLSTARQVTDISGRGVGMDVVASNVRKIGGTIEVHSSEGLGTSMKMRIPLTMAIIPAVIVKIGGECYAIPQVKVAELVRLEGNGGGSGDHIEMLEGRKVYRLRGDLLALLDFREFLGMGSMSASQVADGATNIVVLQDDDQRFGLAVDDVIDSMDIVVKPLPEFLKKLKVYSGVTILGDGSLVLIVDISGMAGKAGLTGDLNGHCAADAADGAAGGGLRGEAGEDVDYVVADIEEKGLYALPLMPIYRLEQFALKDLKTSAGSHVVRYSNSVLSLITVRKLLDFDDKISDRQPRSDPVPVVVVNYGNRQVGLIVEQIFDVIRTAETIQPLIEHTPGILGTIIVNDQVMTVVDIYGLMERLFKNGAEEEEPSAQPAHMARRRRILLIDDSSFYRRYIGQFLDKNGYEVVLARQGEEALSILRQTAAAPFDVVITDIEMPVMDGIELVREIRKNEKWRNLPVVAISNHTQSQEIARGVAAGMTRYFHKLGGEVLLDELKAILEPTGLAA